MASLKDLDARVKKIEARNARVESDKAWETSNTRRVLLIVFTYLAMGLFLQAANIAEPWLNALGAAAGFLLSTLTLPFLKKVWVRLAYKK